MTTLTVSADNFEKNVLQAEKPTIVDFWAEWCGPCKMISPILEEIGQEMSNKIQIAKVNIDENPDLAVQYGVRSIPTLLLFKNGKLMANMIGAAPKTKLLSWIEQNL